MKFIINVMNGDLYFDGKKFISSNRAAKITGYVNDYIGQLCRDGKLDCRMIGRSWYVSFDSLIAHKNANGNGTKSRSQKHIRKIAVLETAIAKENQSEGITTSYVSTPPSANTPVLFVKKEELINFDNGLPFSSKKPERNLEDNFPLKYENENVDLLPVLNKTFDNVFVSNVQEKALNEGAIYHEHKKFLAYIFPRAIAGVLSLFIALAGFWFFLHTNKSTEIAYNNFFDSLQINSVEILGNTGEALEANVFSGAKNIIDSTSVTVYRVLNNWFKKAERRIFVMTGKSVPQEIKIEIENENTKPDQGMVVVPVNEKTDREATVAKIKDSFSDEVTVIPSADGTDGVITPVFKKVKDDDYLYVLVPINN